MKRWMFDIPVRPESFETATWRLPQDARRLEGRIVSKRRSMAGVTLLEIMLTLAIVGAAFTMYLQYTVQKAENVQVDRTVQQMQQIQNAALAYFVANGNWPGSNCTAYTLSSGTASALQPDYLPDKAMKTPWNTAGATNYVHEYCTSSQLYTIPKGSFIVYFDIGTSKKNRALGDVIVARLPFALRQGGIIVAWVTPPPEALKQIKGVKFAGVYHHGGCVPEPKCPSNPSPFNMVNVTPQIFLVPISVSGVNDNASSNVYPISSFSAYASSSTLSSNPAKCVGSTVQLDCASSGTGSETGRYWRACLQVITERGDVQVTRTDSSYDDYWGQQVSIAAFTRCTMSSEKSGSDLSVYTD